MSLSSRRAPQLLAFQALILAAVLLSACAGEGGSLPPPAIDTNSTTPQPPAISDRSGQNAVVFFLQDGNIGLWEEGGETRTIYAGGDAISVKLSPDRQLITFMKREIITASDLEWFEQISLWVIDLNGGNLRELVPAAQLRQLINSGGGISSKMAQLEWVGATHRIAFSGINYFAQGEGESHASPSGLYVVDADTAEVATLLGAGNSVKFAVSPDGLKAALMSVTGFGFINMDGSSYVPELFGYPGVGISGAAWPSGVWTQDSRAFLLASSYESETGERSLAIRRIPFDGSAVEIQLSLTGSHPDSVAFSPNGRHISFVRSQSWYVANVQGETNPLAAESSAFFFWKRILWSPVGIPYAIRGSQLIELCPDAIQETETCGRPLELGQGAVAADRAETPRDIAYIEWIDDQRFVFTTQEPADLYFGNLDGEVDLIATGSEFFSAMAGMCINDADFALGGQGSQTISVAAESTFEVSWILQNSGTCPWNDSYRLIYLGGDFVDPTNSISVYRDVTIGDEIELLVQISAPSAVGDFEGDWQLFGGDGRPFGPQLRVRATVPNYSFIDLPPERIVGVTPAIMGWLDYGDGQVWALSALDGQIWGIDTETNQTTPPLRAGDLLGSIAAGYGSVWVVGGDANLRRIDPATNTVTATITFELPESITLSNVETGAGSVWVSSTSNGKVYRVNPKTNQVEAEFEVPFAAQIAATDGAVWVVNFIRPFLTRIDPGSNEIGAVIETECAIFGIAANESGVWGTCNREPTLLRIDPATNRVAARFAVGDGVKDVVVTSDAVWVTTRRGGTLMKIDLATDQVLAVYQLGQNTYDMAVDTMDYVWISVQGDGAIWRIAP